MNEMTKSCVEPLSAAVARLVSQPQRDNSRTLWKRCLLDTVLPAVALLSMSVLTVTMIVVVVTTVAHGGWLTPSTYVSVDPWETVNPGPANLREDDIMYPDAVTGGGSQQSDPSFDSQARSTADPGYFAAGMME